MGTKCIRNETTKAFCTHLTQKMREAQAIRADGLRAEYRLQMRFTNQINAYKVDSYTGQMEKPMTLAEAMEICDKLAQQQHKRHGVSKECYTIGKIAICRPYQKSMWRNRENVDQFLNQVNFWNKIALTPDSIYFNPMLVYGSHRGDKVSRDDERFKNAVYVVSPKVYTHENGAREIYEQKTGRNFTEDFKEAREAAERHGIYDTHNGNYGVGYNYDLHQWRIVWIDYGI